MTTENEPDTTSPPPRKRRPLRMVLLLAGPILVLSIGAYIYMNTGRVVSTENAYVKADMIVVSAEVAGRIDKIAVKENEPVTAGQLLIAIDDDPYRVARDRAQSQLEAVSAFVTGLDASYRQALAQLDLAKVNVDFAAREVAREEALADRDLGSERDLDVARHNLDTAQRQIPIIEQQLAQIRAQLGGHIDSGGVEDTAAYKTVHSMLDSANIDLSMTRIMAPIDGVASHVPVDGAYVARGGPVMSIVSTENVWVEANFKETQLTWVRPGQPVDVTIDAYPNRMWRGRVASISQATGAEFSVIPAQNASGNWVKIAQRIPVRIELDSGPENLPLRAGMSVTVEIDTGHNRSAPPYLGFLDVLRSDDNGLK